MSNTPINNGTFVASSNKPVSCQLTLVMLDLKNLNWFTIFFPLFNVF